MKILFKSHKLWGLVENDYLALVEEVKFQENKKNDSKVLFSIQQEVH